jgi:hypothetical protein
MIRTLSSVVVLGAACFGAFGAWHHLRPCAARVDEPAFGRYVEARTASVFAGACHYNGELVTAGREALLAWHFDGGAERGVDLAGLAAVAVVRAEENLKLTEARRALVFVPAGLDAEVRDALVAAVERRAGDALGEVVDVRDAELAVRIEGETYAVSVAGIAELVGSLDADRACCRMPQDVWYEPLVTLQARVVGRSETFAYRGADFGSTWVRHDANDAFVGRFGASTTQPEARGPALVAAN